MSIGQFRILKHNDLLIAEVRTNKIIFFIPHLVKQPVHKIFDERKYPQNLQ